MGTTNGLDLSPDGRTLYVSESQTFQLWAYTISGRTLTDARRLRNFTDADADGLRVDADGMIFLARPGGARVTMMRSDGSIVREIPTTGQKPSNLTFGGPDGRTVYVTQVDGGYVECFRSDQPGREFQPSPTR